MARSSLVLHTRGSPRLLRAILKTVARQRVGEFEVLVADDGDTRISRDVVREFALMSPELPVRHVVLSPPSEALLPTARGAVLRLAFDAVASDYTIFIGTGTLLHPEFVAAHMRMRGEGRALVAPRGVVVRTPLVEQLLAMRSSCRGDLGWLARHALRGDLDETSRGVIVRAPWLRRWLSSSAGALEGGHFSMETAVLRQLIEDSPPAADGVPGFDEQGLGARLAARAVQTIDMSRLAVTYHLEGYAFAAAVRERKAGAVARSGSGTRGRRSRATAAQSSAATPGASRVRLANGRST